MSAQLIKPKSVKQVSILEIVMYFLCLFLAYGFGLPFLISADDWVLVIAGVLVLALLGMWAVSITKRIWSYEDFTNVEGK